MLILFTLIVSCRVTLARRAGCFCFCSSIFSLCTFFRLVSSDSGATRWEKVWLVCIEEPGLAGWPFRSSFPYTTSCVLSFSSLARATRVDEDRRGEVSRFFGWIFGMAEVFGSTESAAPPHPETPHCGTPPRSDSVPTAGPRKRGLRSHRRTPDPRKPRGLRTAARAQPLDHPTDGAAAKRSRR